MDYGITIANPVSSHSISPLQVMQLQQRNQLGEGNLAYKEQLLALKQQQVDNALANAAAGRAKSDFEVNQMKAVKDILANRVSPAVAGQRGVAYSGTGVSTDPNADLYNKILDTGDIKSANEFLTGQKTAADVQSAVTKSIDDRLDLWKNKAPSVTTPEDAGAFSLAMQQDPLLSQFSHIVGDPQAAAAKSAALFAKDPQAWYTSMVKLTGEQFITAIKPTLKEVGANQNLVSVSPSGEVKTLMEGENKTQGGVTQQLYATLGKVLTDPEFVKTPAYAQAYAQLTTPVQTQVIGPNGETTVKFVPRQVPEWAPKPTAGAFASAAAAPAPAPAAPVAATLPGAQATAIPAGGIANTLAYLNGNGASVNNLGASPETDMRPKANVVARTTTDADGTVHQFNSFGDEIKTSKGAGKPMASQGSSLQLTPDALDAAAHTYILSGTLPPGMGKNATEIRTQIMNRATELADGKTPEEFAASLRVNRNDSAAMKKATSDFSTGTQGKLITAFNTAEDHLETVGTIVDALKNNDTKLANKLANDVKGQFGDVPLAEFGAAKKVVANEIIKAITASGGALADREEAEAAFNAASSPAQLKGVINTYQKLLAGHLNSLELQYKNTTGKTDFGTKLSNQSKAALTRVSDGSSGGGGKTGTTSSGVTFTIEE